MKINWARGIAVLAIGLLLDRFISSALGDNLIVWLSLSIGTYIYRKWHVNENTWKKVAKACSIYIFTVPITIAITVAIPLQIAHYPLINTHLSNPWLVLCLVHATF